MRACLPEAEYLSTCVQVAGVYLVKINGVKSLEPVGVTSTFDAIKRGMQAGSKGAGFLEDLKPVRVDTSRSTRFR